jgi:hypothetical protein
VGYTTNLKAFVSAPTLPFGIVSFAEIAMPKFVHGSTMCLNLGKLVEVVASPAPAIGGLFLGLWKAFHS